MNPSTIARPSVASLFLEMRQAGVTIGTGTGFIVERDSTRYLVTNRHIVRGILPDGRVIPPDRLAIYQNVAGKLGIWDLREEELYDTPGVPRWFEHPTYPADVDVAALPLGNDAGIHVYGYDPWSQEAGMTAEVSEPLNIIGFPFGITGGGAFGVWIRGFVATEPNVDWNNLPCFLINSRTRPGQSGSPVIAYSPNTGAALQRFGIFPVTAGPAEQFFGVYSGRINAQSDLGIVWKAQAVRDVIDEKRELHLDESGAGNEATCLE